MADLPTMVELFGSVLDLCAVHDSETVAVLTEDGDLQDYADAYLRAARDRGAAAFQINLARAAIRAGGGAKRTALSGNEGAIRVLERSDLVIDLVGLLWSAEQKRVQAADTRILMCREPIEVITRMFPTAALRRRVEAAQRLLAAASELRITSRAGTDLTYRLGQYPAMTQYGYTDTPGRWDNLPGGFLYTGADDGAVDGSVVVDVGDLIFPFKRYVASPITLQVEGGRVTSIEGKGVDAEMLRAYMHRWRDDRAYAVSHIGWGMDEKAQWEFFGTNPVAARSGGTDGRAFCGNVLFSTGPNVELGGDNDTGCHLDIPLRSCHLRLDGNLILESGEIVPAELQV